MRVLIDTNIFVYREGHAIIPDNLQQLEKNLKKNKVEILVHPESLGEVKNDPDKNRRDICLSKISIYPVLEGPEYIAGKETKFDSGVGAAKNENDRVDNAILYSVYKDAVDYLVTNDHRFIKKAVRVGLSERVLEIDDALDLFRRLYPEPRGPIAPPSLEEVPVSSLEVNEKILDTLKREYYDFVEWFKKISRKGRNAWVFRREDKSLGAIMSYKIEEDPIELEDKTIHGKKRLKICLLKSEEQGQKIGELFLKMAFDYAVKNNIFDLYLTHFTGDADSFVVLIEKYGFYPIGKTKKYGDDVFYKRIYTEGNEHQTIEPIMLNKLLFPAYYDGEKVNKFIIPIQPRFLEKLFIEQPRTAKLMEFSGKMIVEGNTISKVYICHSKIKKLKPGDVLMFYRSASDQGITCVGTVEEVHQRQTNADKIVKIVGKRTVYSLSEIQNKAKKPTLVIKFRWHLNFKNPVGYKTLKKLGLIAPQSIMQVSDEQYKAIKENAELDDRLTVN
ncbi:MAG: EVE domain-containing protein [Candidatus Bathyarchaeota archaeon]